MVVENFPNFIEWLFTGTEDSQPAILLLLGIALAATLLGTFMGYVIASFKHGPAEAFYVVAQVVSGAIPDFLGISLRRVSAIARLAIKEALRRKVILVTFGIFALTLLFGGWFLNGGTMNPDRIYVNFVLWGTQLLVLLMGMLISSFSLPEDIKNRTIFYRRYQAGSFNRGRTGSNRWFWATGNPVAGRHGLDQFCICLARAFTHPSHWRCSDSIHGGVL